MRGKRADAFALRNGRSSRHARDDDALRNVRQCVLHVERRRRAAERADAGRVVVGDALFVKRVHLLADRAVQTRVAGVQPHSHPSAVLRLVHHGKDLLERHFRAVVYPASVLSDVKQFRVHQGTCIDDDVGFLQKPLSAHRDQIFRAASGAHKTDHASSFMIVTR